MRLTAFAAAALTATALSAAACNWDDCANISSGISGVNDVMGAIYDRQDSGDNTDPADYIVALAAYGDALQAEWQGVGCGAQRMEGGRP